MHNKFRSVNFGASVAHHWNFVEFSELQDLQIRWYDVRLWYRNQLHCVIFMLGSWRISQNTKFVKMCFYRRVVSFSSLAISNMQNSNIILIYFPAWAVIVTHSDLHSLAQNSFNALGVSDNMPFEINSLSPSNVHKCWRHYAQTHNTQTHSMKFQWTDFFLFDFNSINSGPKTHNKIEQMRCERLRIICK